MTHNEYYNECRKLWSEEGNVSSHEYNDYLTNVITTKLEGKAIRDMMQIYNKNIINMRSLTPEYSMIDVDTIPEVEEVSERVCMDIAEILSTIMGSHMKLMTIKLKRHKNVDNITLPAFNWHQDLHPDPVVNVMVYISDVDTKTGPFEYVTNRDGRGCLIDTTTHDFPASYVDEMIENDGCKINQFLGKPGSMCIFNNNILHRGSVPTKNHRDVLLFQFRPTPKKIEKQLDWNYLNRSWDQLLNWDDNK